MTTSPGSIHHIEYYVNDLTRSRDFWSWFLRRFNYSEYQKWDQGQSWRHESGAYIVIVQVEKEHLTFVNNRQAQGLNHLALWGSPDEDLKLLSTQLEQHGAEVLKVDDTHICFETADNIVVEVFIE